MCRRKSCCLPTEREPVCLLRHVGTETRLGIRDDESCFCVKTEDLHSSRFTCRRKSCCLPTERIPSGYSAMDIPELGLTSTIQTGATIQYGCSNFGSPRYLRYIMYISFTQPRSLTGHVMCLLLAMVEKRLQICNRLLCTDGAVLECTRSSV